MLDAVKKTTGEDIPILYWPGVGILILSRSARLQGSTDLVRLCWVIVVEKSCSIMFEVFAMLRARAPSRGLWMEKERAAGAATCFATSGPLGRRRKGIYSTSGPLQNRLIIGYTLTLQVQHLSPFPPLLFISASQQLEQLIQPSTRSCLSLIG